ncbi:hypothetical protein M2222_008304 [Bradyrhizobium elkanii]|uniref:autotransporter adhesin family protein n=1 Tax=Bradyrhizobium elkanii TaxID=29448 RepID=UPI0021686F1B|nr:autotransporter adhesin family protein [Bradyrhizobium elkanii]MCS3451919.1 hypothetical protein [Bradyrhizobium elkanii]MCS3565982.1 hypothetical protein [Bradyrhizobium elkanii]MCW2153288.1 hypothetical protein [Bradyrhizobium elkanii]MCW2377021.1 hypothetical protein [Bradyrhizobium elkanii]
MTGIIVVNPPPVDPPPSNTSGSASVLGPLSYTPAIPTLPQTWSGLQTFLPGTIILSGTGAPSNVVVQETPNGPVTVRQLAFADISGSLSPVQIPSAALTSVNDTNVTLALGGSPNNALLAATSITVGWTGTLAASRGGFGSDVSGQSGVPLFATGVATFTGTTGSGVFVRTTSPTLVTPTITVNDGSFTLQNTTDTTKKAVFSLSGIGTGTTRTYSLPNASDTFTLNGTAQTLTNKTISGASNTITNVALAGLASQGAFTFVGNNTSGSASPTAVDIAALTSKASPASSDLVMISDQAASGAWKKVTVSSLASAGSVASLNGLTGAINLVVSIQKFTSSGTYTPSSGMVHAIIECLGGGAAGGGSASNASFLVSGGGGGAGSYSRKVATAASVGASQTVTIGAGGTGATGNVGGNGGDTSVGTLCIGKGGSGGNFGSSAAFGRGGAGGVAGTGDVTLPGANGGDGAYQSGTNVGIVVPAGMGAVSQFGGGGVQTVSVSGSFAAGTASGGFGGGGSGGMSSFSSTSTAGGAGAPGIVIITEYRIQ